MMITGVMHTAPMAILHSECGALQIFDGDALAKLVMSLPRHSMDAGDIMRGPTPSVTPQILHDGFTVEQWISYGRRKANIASAICKENGLLKKQLAETLRVTVAADLIFEIDPWQSASLTGTGDAATTIVSCEHCEEDAWGNWKKSSRPTSRLSVPDSADADEAEDVQEESNPATMRAAELNAKAECQAPVPTAHSSGEEHAQDSPVSIEDQKSEQLLATMSSTDQALACMLQGVLREAVDKAFDG